MVLWRQIEADRAGDAGGYDRRGRLLPPAGDGPHRRQDPRAATLLNGYLLVALLTALSGALPAPVAFAAGEKLSVSLSPQQPQQSASVNATLTASPDKVRQRISVTGTEFFLPKGAHLSTEKLSRCDKDALQSTDTCPKNALISEGEARIDTSYEAYDHVTADLRFYAGERPGELLMWAKEPFSAVKLVVGGRLKSADNLGYSYGMEFKDIPSEPLGPGTNVFMYLVSIKLQIVSTDVYRNPAKCPPRGWRFGIRFDYASGGSATATDRVSCRY